MLALLLVGAVGLHLEQSGEIEEPQAMAVIEALASAIERRTGGRVEIDRARGDSPCAPRLACLAEIRARLAEDLVLVRLYGSPRKIRLIAERSSAPGAGFERVEVDLTKSPETWTPKLDTAVADLFAAGPAIDLRVSGDAASGVSGVAAEAHGARDLTWPIVVLGASAAVLAAGVAFGLSARDAERTLEGRIHGQPEHDVLAGRQHDHGLAANVLFGVAGAGALASVVLFLDLF